MLRKIMLLAMLGLLVSCSTLPIAGTTAPSTQPATAAPMSLDVCYSTPSGAHLPLWYAYEKGIFEKYGLDIKMVRFSGGSEAATAMIADEIDICQIAGPAIFNAVIAGEDLVMISSLYNVYLYSLMVAPAIKTPEDLKGKALAISEPGAATDLAVRKALESMGLAPDKDVAILAIGSESDRVLAMEAGQVAGTVVVPPTTAKLKEKGYWELMDLSEQGWPYMRLGYATSRDFIKQKRPAVLAFMKAIVDAIAQIKADPVGSKEVLAKYLELDPVADAATLEEAYQVLAIKYLQSVPAISTDAITAVLDEIKTENPAASNFSAGDFIDTSFIDELLASGFIDKISSGK